MSKLQIRIDENKVGGEVYSYHLMTKRGKGSYVGGAEIMNADEMRQIADVLTAKAEEIEMAQYEQMMNKPNIFCEDCGRVLYDEIAVKIDTNAGVIYICSDCDKE